MRKRVEGGAGPGSHLAFRAADNKNALLPRNWIDRGWRGPAGGTRRAQRRGRRPGLRSDQGPSCPPPCAPLPASCPFSLLQPPLSSYYIFSYIFFPPASPAPVIFFLLIFFKTHCTPNAQGRVGAGWGHLPRPGPYPQGIQSCWLWAEPHFATTSPVQSVSPQSLPLWVPISPAIHPKGLPPPMKHPPLWWAQGLGQAFLPSPLPGPLLTPRAIWLMVRTVRQGGSEPLGTQMGGGKGRGQGSGHVPSAQLFPLPLPNKGNSGPDNAGWGWPGTQGSREEKDCGDGHGQEVGVGLACPSSALPLGSRLR